MATALQRWSLVGIAMIMLATVPAGASPLGSNITYQGQLKDAGSPVNNPAMPMSFSLYDAPTDGNLVAGPLNASVVVVDGLFTVALDFGAGAFDGQERWLEITVDVTALSPRQPMTAAPYALHTRGLAVDNNNGNVGIGGALYAEGISLPGAFGPDSAYVGDAGNYLAFGHTGVSEDFIGYAFNTFFFKDSPSGGDSADPSLVVGGNLGVGTDSPSQKLHVIGDALLRGTEGFDEGGDRARLYLGDSATHIDAVHGGGLRFSSFQADDALVVQQGSGYVGIGTTTPGARVDARGAGLVNFFAGDRAPFGVAGYQSDFANPATHAWFAENGARVFSVEGGGNGYFEGDVGIGTTSPGAKLDVNGTARVGGFTLIGNGAGAGRVLTSDAGGNASWQDAPATGGQWAASGNDIYSTNSGNVGIGTTTPAARLDVAGSFKAQTVTVTGGADVAEPYEIGAVQSAKPEAGMLVSIDPDRIGKLRVAASAYDRTVAGVISGANGISPGLVLSQEGSVADGKWPVASSGRVWCLCDADANGAIQPGDLITTSATPGHGMKSSNARRASGCIVGKAMSSLETGRGYVLLLVSLQ